MNKNITVLVDNDSWILPYAGELIVRLRDMGFDAELVRSQDDIVPGWLNFMIGCTRLVKLERLELNQHNLVVHESALPAGRGFAPMAWQILEGRRTIPITLFEASLTPDEGPIWLTDEICLEGYELAPQWRHAQGLATIDICVRFVQEYPTLKPRAQAGEGSWYPRRHPKDSELDIHKPLRELFPLLRIVDNERYPAFFRVEGHGYKLLIEHWDGDLS